MIELPLYTQIEITITFPINYKPVLPKIEKMLKLSLKTLVSISKILPKKPTFARFFKKAYKIRAVTVFLALAILVLNHPSLDLICG